MTRKAEYPFPEKRLGERCESCNETLIEECGIHGAFCSNCFKSCPGCDWDEIDDEELLVDKTFV